MLPYYDTSEFNSDSNSALVPLSGGIIRTAEYFVDPALSFANGWNSIYSSMVSLPAEIVAAAVIVQFWDEVTNSAVYITVFGLLLLASNLCLVRIYGELEFTFAMLKIMLIIGLNIMALVVTCKFLLVLPTPENLTDTFLGGGLFYPQLSRQPLTCY